MMVGTELDGRHREWEDKDEATDVDADACPGALVVTVPESAARSEDEPVRDDVGQAAEAAPEHLHPGLAVALAT